MHCNSIEFYTLQKVHDAQSYVLYRSLKSIHDTSVLLCEQNNVGYPDSNSISFSLFMHYGCASGESFDLNGHAIIILYQWFCLYSDSKLNWTYLFISMMLFEYVIITIIIRIIIIVVIVNIIIIYGWWQKCNSENVVPSNALHHFHLNRKWDFCTWNNSIHQMEMHNGYLCGSHYRTRKRIQPFSHAKYLI